MNMPTFSFRDFIGYIFPGAILILGVILIFWSQVKDVLEFIIALEAEYLAIIVSFLTVITYYAGYASNVLAYNIIRFKPFCKFLGKEDYHDNLTKHDEYGLDKSFIDSLKKRISKKWKNLHFENESNILYLCWHDIQQNKENNDLSQIQRIVSLKNFTLSSIFSFIVLGIGIYYIDIVDKCYSIIPFVIAVLMVFSYRLQSKKFVQSVYRIWYILNKKSRRNNQ